MGTMNSGIENCAAIVCEHIADGHSAILSAYRTNALVSEDSGWQFFCGMQDSEDPERAKTWLLKEVLELEPTLATFVTEPPEVHIWRQNGDSPWQVRRIECQ
jgi:hypothetical protein